MATSLFSDVKAWPAKTATGKIKGNAQFVVAGVLKVRAKIIEGTNGLFVKLPQTSYQKEGKTEYQDEASFITKESNQECQRVVLAEYNKVVKGGGSSSPTPKTSASTGKGKAAPVTEDDEIPF